MAPSPTEDRAPGSIPNSQTSDSRRAAVVDDPNDAETQHKSLSGESVPERGSKTGSSSRHQPADETHRRRAPELHSATQRNIERKTSCSNCNSNGLHPNPCQVCSHNDQNNGPAWSSDDINVVHCVGPSVTSREQHVPVDELSCDTDNRNGDCNMFCGSQNGGVINPTAESGSTTKEENNRRELDSDFSGTMQQTDSSVVHTARHPTDGFFPVPLASSVSENSGNYTAIFPGVPDTERDFIFRSDSGDIDEEENNLDNMDDFNLPASVGM